MPQSQKVNTSFQDLSKDEQIRRALPIARRLLIEGFRPEGNDQTMIHHVGELTNDARLLEEWEAMADEDEHSVFWNRLEAAQSLGIAIGLLLNADLFLRDSAPRKKGHA